MLAEWLKRGTTAEVRAEADRKVRDVVEATLADIEARGWVAAAGIDPIALFKRYPGRFRLMHVKDMRASTRPNFQMRQDPAEVGSGVIPGARILPAALTAGVEDFFVEQEPPLPGYASGRGTQELWLPKYALPMMLFAVMDPLAPHIPWPRGFIASRLQQARQLRSMPAYTTENAANR